MKPEGSAFQNPSSTFSTSPCPVLAKIIIHINYRAYNCANVAKQLSIGDGMGRNMRILQFPGTNIELQKRCGRAALPTKLGKHTHTCIKISVMSSKCESGRWAPLSTHISGSDKTGVVRCTSDCTPTICRGPGADDWGNLGWLMCCRSAGVVWVAYAC